MMNLKSLCVGLVAAASVGTLSACSSASLAPAPLVTPAPVSMSDGTVVQLPPNVAPSASSAQRDVFARAGLVRAGWSESDLSLVKSMCNDFSTGSHDGSDAAMRAAVSNGKPPIAAIQIGVLATMTYCPEFRDRYDRLFMSGHGVPVKSSPDSYKGAQDSGTIAGRAPTSGEVQHANLCRMGVITDGC